MKRLFNILFSSRQRIKITIAIATIVALSGITLYITLSGLGIHWPTEERISEKKFELKKQRRELRLALERATLLSNKEHTLEQVIKNFWEVKPDTHIDSNMRAKIETCAKNAGFELQSMGNIRKSKLAKGFNKLEITISANSTMDKVVYFLNNIRQAKPEFFWQQCSIRPDNITNPDKVYLNGTLAIVSVDQAEVEKLLKQEAK
ncbi:MAG: hypothetical protein L3J71_05950 [Victivallaceae bacterium]|nr:hypothetical protein [Victivallaceae bacterium]